MVSERRAREGRPSRGSEAASDARQSDGACLRCGATLGGRPFCGRDGALARAFALSGGRYRVHEALGAGGMALVFGARHADLDREVAIKVLRPELASESVPAERFLREARLASRIRHPNVVAVTDFGRDETLELHYLVMDRVHGPSLESALEEGKPLPWRRVVDLLGQVTDGLEAAHQAGVVHRDLSLRNIVLERGPSGREVAKVCDFGLSRALDGDDRITTTGQMAGTPATMAPEQIRGDADQDARVDLYALGTIAYELLSGRLPHAGATPVATVAAKLSEPPAPLPSPVRTETPERLVRLVESCLANTPADRPASATEVRDVLDAVQGGDHAPRRFPWLAIAAAVAALLAVGAWALLGPSEATPEETAGATEREVTSETGTASPPLDEPGPPEQPEPTVAADETTPPAETASARTEPARQAAAEARSERARRGSVQPSSPTQAGPSPADTRPPPDTRRRPAPAEREGNEESLVHPFEAERRAPSPGPAPARFPDPFE